MVATEGEFNLGDPVGEECVEMQHLAQFIENEPLGTFKSKAFCDFVDKIHLDMGAFGPERCARMAAINETIRHRRNELPGYKIAMDEIDNLYKSFEVVLKKASNKGIVEVSAPETLHTIKERYISSSVFRVSQNMAIFPQSS
jgi:hypothetical protein